MVRKKWYEEIKAQENRYIERMIHKNNDRLKIVRRKNCIGLLENQSWNAEIL